MNTTSSSREEAYRKALLLSPATTLASLRPTGFDDVFTSLQPRLNELPNDRALALITLAINHLIPCLNTPERLNAQGVKHAAELVLFDYGHLLLDDIVLCTNMGLKGQLEEFYGRFDVQVIYSWFYQYNILRTQAARLHDLRSQ